MLTPFSILSLCLSQSRYFFFCQCWLHLQSDQWDWSRENMCYWCVCVCVLSHLYHSSELCCLFVLPRTWSISVWKFFHKSYISSSKEGTQMCLELHRVSLISFQQEWLSYRSYQRWMQTHIICLHTMEKKQSIHNDLFVQHISFLSVNVCSYKYLFGHFTVHVIKTLIVFYPCTERKHAFWSTFKETFVLVLRTEY